MFHNLTSGHRSPTLAGKMPKDSEDLLGEAIDKMQKQIAINASIVAARQESESDRVNQINRNYQKYIQPTEQQILSERPSAEFQGIFKSFRGRAEQKLRRRFNEITIFNWGGAGITTPYSLNFRRDGVNEKDAIKNRETVLELLKKGELYTKALVYEKIWYANTDHTHGLGSINMYIFGYSSSDSETEWRLREQSFGRLSETGLQSLIDTFAYILTGTGNQFCDLEPRPISLGSDSDWN